MKIGSTLNLKDYRIIKLLLSKKNPIEYTAEINLELPEIKKRLEKIKKFLGEYLKIN